MVGTPNQSKLVLACGKPIYSLKDFDSGTTAVVSPNRANKVLLAKNGSFLVLRAKNEIGALQLPNLSSNVEVMWAPDSEKFSITYSDGGAEGAFHAHVYLLTPTGVTELTKLPEIAFEEFKQHYYCSARGNNIYALGWTSNSKQIFFVTQVYPTGDCGENFGRYGGYLLDLEGNIVRRYGDKQTELIQDACWRTGHVVLLSSSR